MLIRFWGTRGSLPIALTAPQVQAKVAQALLAASGRQFADLAAASAYAASLPFAVTRTFGGHSSCVEIELKPADGGSHEYVICDLGSGVRPFGGSVIAQQGVTTPNVYHVFMSHLHWDHIMGFPLFTPAYIPGNLIRIYGCHQNLEAAFRAQHGAPSFPVDFSQLAARIEFVTLTPGEEVTVAGLKVLPKEQIHAGGSYGYRFEHAGKVCVYSTDSEHKLDDADVTDAFIDFFRDADLVVFDAMYSFAEAISVKEDWGHSSNVVGVELCQLANAKRLALFHHEPIHDDARIANIEAETRRFEEITRVDAAPLDVFSAYDGLEITL